MREEIKNGEVGFIIRRTVREETPQGEVGIITVHHIHHAFHPQINDNLILSVNITFFNNSCHATVRINTLT